MTRLRRFVLASALSAAVTIVPWSTGSAHQGRGVLLQERDVAAPATGYEPPAPETLGGPFELTDHNGRTVTNETYHGRWVVMFFGFTGCRESCPLALDRIGQALDELGPAADKIQPLFVDLDYGPPDVEGLAQFVGNFDKRIVGLTGSRAQIYSILRDYKVRRQMMHAASGKKETGPRIDHSTYIFMIDPEGKTRSYFYHTLTPSEMAAHMRRHL